MWIDELPHGATPTLVSSEIEFSEDQEPFASGVLRTDPATQVFDLNLAFYLRKSCGLVVAEVGRSVGSPLTNVELEFYSAHTRENDGVVYRSGVRAA